MPAGRSAPSLATSRRKHLKNPSPRRHGGERSFKWSSHVGSNTGEDGSIPAAATILTVNNIEVIYDHVILVLKGVSLDVPKGGIVALLGAVGAEQGDDAAARHVERNALQHQNNAVVDDLDIVD